MTTKQGWILLVAAGTAALLLPGCAKQADEASLVARGKQLVERAGCNGCHSPKIITDHGPVIDDTRLLSGHPENDMNVPRLEEDKLDSGWVAFNPNQTCWVGPWGAAFAANLTPDPETGLGEWDEDMFIDAVRGGSHRQIAGAEFPMPWAKVGSEPNRDLKAIFAYLRSLPPVKNHVPPRVPLRGLVARQHEGG